MKKTVNTCLVLLIFIAPFLNIVPVNASKEPDLTGIESVISPHDISNLLTDLPKEARFEDPYLQLVNKENRLAEEPSFERAYTDEGYSYHAGVRQDYIDMMQAGEEAGYEYQTISAYRSMQHQLNNREARYQYYLDNGMSSQDAQYWLDAYYAPMDGTEHLLGLAFDIFGFSWMARGGLFSNEYTKTEEFKWLANHAHEFGFILRFPDHKVDITGYFFEPWHYRYVGKIHAQFMYEHDLTLEEYLYLVKLRESSQNHRGSSNQKEENSLELEPTNKGHFIH